MRRVRQRRVAVAACARRGKHRFHFAEERQDASGLVGAQSFPSWRWSGGIRMRKRVVFERADKLSQSSLCLRVSRACANLDRVPCDGEETAMATGAPTITVLQQARRLKQAEVIEHELRCDAGSSCQGLCGDAATRAHGLEQPPSEWLSKRLPHARVHERERGGFVRCAPLHRLQRLSAAAAFGAKKYPQAYFYRTNMRFPLSCRLRRRKGSTSAPVGPISDSECQAPR